MRKNVFKLAMIVMALFVTTACFAQAGKVNNFRIKRGTNISHWLSQSEQRGEARRLHIQEDDFARLESLGFDFVRIPIDEEQFWDEKGNGLGSAEERPRLEPQVQPACHRGSAHHPLSLFQRSERE